MLKSENGCFKIGRTKKIDKRLIAIQREYPLKIDLIHIVETTDCHVLERYLHEMFEASRLQGEWFKLRDEQVKWLMTLDKNKAEKLIDEFNSSELNK